VNFSLSLPAPTKSNACRKAERKSKKNVIRAPMKNVREILAKMPPLNRNNRGQKTAAARHSPKTTSGALSYRCQPGSNSSLEQDIIYIGTMETNDDFMSLEPDVFHTSMRLTPLTFDDTQVPNHFRSNAEKIRAINQQDDTMDIVEPSSSNERCTEEELQIEGMSFNRWQECDAEEEDFSLHLNEEDMSTPLNEKVISMHVHESDNEESSVRGINHELRQEEENRMRFNEMLNKVVTCRGIGHKSTPEMFYASYNSTISDLSSMSGHCQGGLFIRRNSSNDSIPSLSAGHNAEGGIIAPPTNALSVDDVADSTIAWGCLAALMNSPAPSPVRFVSLPHDEIEGKVPHLDIVEASEECTIPPCNDVVPDLDNHLQYLEFPTSPPKVKSPKIEDSALARSALEALGSPAPSSATKKCTVEKCVNLLGYDVERDLIEADDDMMSLHRDDYKEMPSFDLVDTTDNCGIPSCHDIIIRDVDEFTGIDFPTTPTKAKSRKAEDSALAWSVLGAILGSPAPSSVKKKSVGKCFTLWGDGESDLIPEISGLSCESAGDDNPIDLTELLVESDNNTVPAVLVETAQTDALLAWSALGMLLGSPAPKSVPRKCAMKKCFSLWGTGGESDPMPEIEAHRGGHDDEGDPLPEIGQCGRDDDDLSALFDLNELLGENSDGPVPEVSIQSTQTDSVLAWSALGMLLGSPVPKSISKKCRKNLWDDGSSKGNDSSNVVPFIFTGDENDAIILPQWKIPLGQKSWLGCNDGEDSHSTQSFSRMPSLSATSSDGEEDAPGTPVSQLIMLFENL
jgi:hypothetical protein